MSKKVSLIVQGDVMVPNNEVPCLNYGNGMADVYTAINFLRCGNPAVQLFLPTTKPAEARIYRNEISEELRLAEYADEQFSFGWSPADEVGRTLIILRGAKTRIERATFGSLTVSDEFYLDGDDAWERRFLKMGRGEGWQKGLCVVIGETFKGETHLFPDDLVVCKVIQ